MSIFVCQFQVLCIDVQKNNCFNIFVTECHVLPQKPISSWCAIAFIGFKHFESPFPRFLSLLGGKFVVLTDQMVLATAGQKVQEAFYG